MESAADSSLGWISEEIGGPGPFEPSEVEAALPGSELPPYSQIASDRHVVEPDVEDGTRGYQLQQRSGPRTIHARSRIQCVNSSGPM